MPRRRSPQPESFADPRERDFWHAAQDIAFGANVALYERDGKSWILDESGERLLCEPVKPSTLWQESQWKLSQLYPQFTHLWIGVSQRSKPRFSELG